MHKYKAMMLEAALAPLRILIATDLERGTQTAWGGLQGLLSGDGPERAEVRRATGGPPEPSLPKRHANTVWKGTTLLTNDNANADGGAPHKHSKSKPERFLSVEHQRML